MIERIGTAVTAQAAATQNAENRKVSGQEQSAAQPDKLRKFDRFESSEVSRYGSPDDPQARKAFDEQHKAVQ